MHNVFLDLCLVLVAILTSRSGSRPRRSSHKKSRNDSTAEEEGEIRPVSETRPDTDAAIDAVAATGDAGTDAAAADNSRATAATIDAVANDAATADASSNGVPNGEHAAESAAVQQP
jgi:hypothetical protein